MYRVGLSILAVAFVISGCGKTNPAEDYSNLKSIPGEVKAVEHDGSYAPNLLNIQVLGASETNYGIFVEGKQGSIQLKVTPYGGVTDYVLKSYDMPSGAVLQKTSTLNVWAVVWTPPVGTVPPTETSVPRNFTVVGFPLRAVDPKLLSEVSTSNPIDITVNRTAVIPSVTGINGYKDRINEGEDFAFSLDVTDPATAVSPPDIVVEPFDSGQNREQFKLDGTPYVHSGSLESMGGGVWRRNFLFSVSQIDPKLLLDPKSNYVKVCESFIVESSFGNRSHSKSLCTDVWFVQETPEFDFDGAPMEGTPIQVNAGSVATIKFRGTIMNKRGVSEVKVTNKDFSQWPGKPSLSCVNGDNNDATQQVCTITWNIPCDIKTAQYKLNVEGFNTQSSKSPSHEFRDIEISKSACPQTATIEKTSATVDAKAPSKTRKKAKLPPKDQKTRANQASPQSQSNASGGNP